MSDHEDTELDVDPAEATKREGPGDRVLRPTGTPKRPDTPIPEPEQLERGTEVGRYMVLGVLGQGGMGVVYSAYDPELDRKVAIKLLSARSSDSLGSSETGTDQAWLLREAQAMARLSHPNVIAVHDVGTLPPDRVFIAMEQVDGVTLRAWLRTERPWRDIIPVMVAAGEGLAAAHDRGLVHRDFKPDNVLVGDDGRVRVMDFGLARLRPDDIGMPPDRSELASNIDHTPLSAPLTVAGTLIGTPAYMAPEVAQPGEMGRVAADARSDQFSFGVALYEALYRMRPFSKDTPRTKPRPPPVSKVPERVQRVVFRAISADPEARYRSMAELLEDLSRAAAPRRRPLIAAGLVLGLGAAAAAGFLASSASAPAAQPDPPQLCKGAERRLAGVWDDAAKKRVHDAFVATKRTYAESAYVALAHAFDSYTTEWTAAATDACEDTRIRGEQTEDVLSLREACLDQRLDELRALVGLLGEADAAIVERGDKLAFGLEPVSRCANVAALRAPGLPPTEPKDKVDKLRDLLATSKAELLAGRSFGAMEAARKAALLAEEVHYGPYRADALMVRAAALAGVGNSAEAGKAFGEAAWTALDANRHDQVAMAAMSAAAIAADGRVGEAKIWMGLARTAARRIGNDPLIEQRMLQIEGLIAAAQGDTAGAIEAQTKALAISERALGENNPALWSDLEVIGVTLAKRSSWARAKPYLERALALRVAAVGSDHPDVATILTNLGAAYANSGEPDKARASYERAIKIRERTDGARNPMLILTLNNMADGMTKAKDYENALHYVERGIHLAETMLGKSAPMYHAIATTYAEALFAAGRTADARKVYDETIAIEAKESSPFYPATLASRAEMSIAARHWKEAIALEQRAIAAFEAASGKDNPDLWKPLFGLARVELAQHRAAEARELLDRAIAIGEKAQISSADLESMRTFRKKL